MAGDHAQGGGFARSSGLITDTTGVAYLCDDGRNSPQTADDA